MTASVALRELVPGDQVLDLVAAGTVANVEAMVRSNGKPTDGTILAGPSGWTVVTMREAVDA